MAKRKNIIGGEISTQMLKIRLGEDYPFRFRPDINTTSDPAEIKELVSKVELLIYKISDPALPEENPSFSFIGTLVGTEILYSILISSDQSSGSNADLLGFYQAIVAEVERDPSQNIVQGSISSPIVTFNFKLVDPATETIQDNAFSAIEQIPRNLEELKDIKVSLKPGAKNNTLDLEFWEQIRNSTKAISFTNYATFINTICGNGSADEENTGSNGALRGLTRRRFLPFNDTDSYRTIKVLTEFFLLVNCTLDVKSMPYYPESLNPGDTDDGNVLKVIPYMKIIRQRLNDLAIKPKDIGDVLNIFLDAEREAPRGSEISSCYGILRDKLVSPCLIELIWSYWHEEAMLVQAMNAVSLRFQNRKQNGQGKDPLTNMAIAPLLPLNNLLWGYVQDEQHRLSVLRRAYEYDHHYGITLQGKAVPNVEGADSRSNFLEAFHTLLNRCTLYFKQVDDLTIKADGFPVLNALREVHFILSEGMHNQYGDLPWNARAEMLMQQWMLSRPEFREFLPTRTMVAFPEPWMGPLSSMNNLQSWTNNSPINFNSLAVYGEALLLSIRFGNWNDQSLSADNAANWADFWRNDIQGYIHAYRTVTGVDLTTPHPQTGKIDAQQPALHLLQRAKMTSNGNAQSKVLANGKSPVGH